MAKTAKISDLKAHLSEHLANVRRGKPLIVLDRAVPIARIVPYEDEAHEAGIVVDEPRQQVSSLRHVEGVSLRMSADLNRLLRDLRGER